MRTLSVGLKIKNSPPALLRYGTMDFLNVIMLAGFREVKNNLILLFLYELSLLKGECLCKWIKQ